MAIYEVQGADGKTYEVDAPDMQTAVSALQSVIAPSGGVSADSAGVSDFNDKARAFATGAANGASLGFGDNIAAGIGGAASLARGDGFRSGYDETLDIVREGMARDQKQNPAMFGGGNIAGAAVPAIAAAPLSGGGSLLGTMARGAGIGAVEGAATGAGNADGQDVAQAAGTGGILGSFLGAAAPAAVAGGSRVARAVSDPATGILDSITGRANQTKANREIAAALSNSKQSPEDVRMAVMRAAQEGQPEFRTLDALGSSGQRMANGIVRGGDGPASREIADFLASRQAGQGERVATFVDDGFGMGGQTAKQTQDGLTTARNDAASINYDAARGNAAPVDVRGALAVIDDRIGGVQGSNVTGDGIDAKMSRYRSRLAADPAPNGEISRELSDFDRVLGVKQAVQDDIGAAVRAGRNNEARELGKLVSALDGALENSSDMYRTANDSFREASRNIDAVDQGAAMSRPSARAQDTIQQFNAMTPEQQAAARAGYGDQLLSKIEANASPTANRAKPLQSPKRVDEAQAMASDPDVFARRLDRESQMWETQNTALRGSATANNIEDISRSNQAVGGLARAAQSGANFQVGDAVAQVMAVLGPVAKGQTEATRQLVARALLSDDPMKALAPAIKQDKNSQMRRRFLEGIIRSAGTASLN